MVILSEEFREMVSDPQRRDEVRELIREDLFEKRLNMIEFYLRGMGLNGGFNGDVIELGSCIIKCSYDDSDALLVKFHYETPIEDVGYIASRLGELACRMNMSVHICQSFSYDWEEEEYGYEPPFADEDTYIVEHKPIR